jgi:hypothetical protein
LRKQSRGNHPSSSLSCLASAPSNNVSAIDTITKAIKITPQTNDEADDSISTSDSEDSNKDNGKCGSDIAKPEYPDNTFGGLISSQLKDKAAQLAKDSKQKRLQRAYWRNNSQEGMTYGEHQGYLKRKHTPRIDEKANMATLLPEGEAKMDKKRKDREWKEKSEVIEAIFENLRNFCKRRRKKLVKFMPPLLGTFGFWPCMQLMK